MKWSDQVSETRKGRPRESSGAEKTGGARYHFGNRSKLGKPSGI